VERPSSAVAPAAPAPPASDAVERPSSAAAPAADDRDAGDARRATERDARRKADRDASDARRATDRGAGEVKRAVAPERGRSKSAGGAAVGRGDDPTAGPRRAPDAAPERREPVPGEAPEPRPARADPPRVERAPAVAPGISAADLGHLFDAVKSEIEELPEANRRGLLDRLAMINIMSAMRGSQEQRDEAAARLVEVRQRARDRKATR
jgi:hypothetical protein